MTELKTHTAAFSGNNEWYTPSKYIEHARHVMGSIDVDPASCAEANETVKAGRYYDIESDGLAQKWSGNVWMNPPYARGVMEQFIDALISKFEEGEVSQAVVLVNNCTETQWFQRLCRRSQGMCFVERRIQFNAPKGEFRKSPIRGQIFFYFGPLTGAIRFHETFVRVGDVWSRGIAK